MPEGITMLCEEIANSNGLTPQMSRKKQHGRPRKVTHTPCEPLIATKQASNSRMEAHRTWETAKLLGITSNDENAVISGLRKSKRILFLEDGTV